MSDSYYEPPPDDEYEPDDGYDCESCGAAYADERRWSGTLYMMCGECFDDMLHDDYVDRQVDAMIEAKYE